MTTELVDLATEVVVLADEGVLFDLLVVMRCMVVLGEEGESEGEVKVRRGGEGGGGPSPGDTPDKKGSDGYSPSEPSWLKSSTSPDIIGREINHRHGG